MTRKIANQTHQQKPTATLVGGGLLQRKCACGNHTVVGGGCAEHENKKKNSGLQRKLTIGASNDPLEWEADRVADQVMAAPANSAVSGARLHIQRYTGQTTGQTDTAPASVDQALASPGRPLEPALKQDMEQRFGHDFSRVRVHSGSAAEQSARDVNANAYTVGHNIVFGVGRYSPYSPVGRRLLSHELAHVVQQQGATERLPVRNSVDKSGTLAERQAEEAARNLVILPSHGQPVLDSDMPGVSLQRQEQSPICTDREPNSNAVNEIIEKAYGGSRKFSYPVDELKYAWYNVRNQREHPGGANCCSPELAAAEHYLYARYAVANRDHFPFEMKALIWGYGYLKFFVPKTGICPKSPDTQGSRYWGYRGVDDGADDLFHQSLAQNDRGQAEAVQA